MMVLSSNILQLKIGKIGRSRREMRRFLTQIKIINLSVELLATTAPRPRKRVQIKSLDRRETAT